MRRVVGPVVLAACLLGCLDPSASPPTAQLLVSRAQRGRANSPPPEGTPQAAQQVPVSDVGFMAFHRGSTLPAVLEHGALSNHGWSIDYPVPSGIETRRKLTIGKNALLWARFILDVHDSVHPLFADQYLRSLDKLPKDSPFQESSLHVELELRVAQASGELEAIGVRRSSGLPEFDLAAAMAFTAAFPRQVPEEVASSDGRAYLTWDIRRDASACSTLHAHPYRLE